MHKLLEIDLTIRIRLEHTLGINDFDFLGRCNCQIHTIGQNHTARLIMIFHFTIDGDEDLLFFHVTHLFEAGRYEIVLAGNIMGRVKTVDTWNALQMKKYNRLRTNEAST